MSEIWTVAFLISLCAATLRLATPLILAGLGEMISERAGVLNIGIEGNMLIGSLVGFLVSFGTRNAWAGILGGMAAGALMGLVSAYLSVSLAADQIVSGLGINIFAIGITGATYRFIFGISASRQPGVRLGEWAVPGLHKIPILGDIFFQQNPLVYAAFLLVPVVGFILMKTPFGLQVRAAGEYPLAVETAGVSIVRLRYLCVILAGMGAGLAGAFLSVGHMNMFFDNMTQGRGFITLAAVIFGRWRSGGTMWAALLFGAADALQVRLQALGAGLPFQILLMLPYVATMAALAGVIGRARLPAALGIPFAKEKI